MNYTNSKYQNSTKMNSLPKNYLDMEEPHLLNKTKEYSVGDCHFRMGSARLVCRTQLLLYRASVVVALPRIDFLGYIGLYSVERLRKGTLHGWNLL